MFHIIRRAIYSVVKGASGPRCQGHEHSSRPSGPEQRQRTPAWVSQMDPEAARSLDTVSIVDLQPQVRSGTLTSATPTSCRSATMDLPMNLPRWVLEIDPYLELDPKWANINKGDLHPSPIGLLRINFKAFRNNIIKSHSES